MLKSFGPGIIRHFWLSNNECWSRGSNRSQVRVDEKGKPAVCIWEWILVQMWSVRCLYKCINQTLLVLQQMRRRIWPSLQMVEYMHRQAKPIAVQKTPNRVHTFHNQLHLLDNSHVCDMGLRGNMGFREERWQLRSSRHLRNQPYLPDTSFHFALLPCALVEEWNYYLWVCLIVEKGLSKIK